VEWLDGQYVRYEKNENYWNKANYDPYFNDFYVYHTPEPTSAIAAHVSGSIEAYLSGGLSYDLIGLYNGTEGRTELVTVETNSTTWFGLSFREGSVWNDIDVRRAFNLAIDRQAIIDNIYYGKASIPVGYFHSSILGHDPNAGSPEFDPDLARELLANSTYDGRKITMMSTASAFAETLFLAIADMVNQVGFNMDVEFIDITAFTPRQNAGDYDLFQVTNSIPDGIPQRQLNRIPNQMDKTEWHNEEMNELILKVFSELDPVKRVEHATKVNNMIYELKAPFISLVHRAMTTPVDYGIVGIDMWPDGLLNWTFIDWDASKLP
jgi:ABC-type transport system substrate-binding protein